MLRNCQLLVFMYFSSILKYYFSFPFLFHFSNNFPLKWYIWLCPLLSNLHAFHYIKVLKNTSCGPLRIAHMLKHEFSVLASFQDKWTALSKRVWKANCFLIKCCTFNPLKYDRDFDTIFFVIFYYNINGSWQILLVYIYISSLVSNMLSVFKSFHTNSRKNYTPMYVNEKLSLEYRQYKNDSG